MSAPPTFDLLGPHVAVRAVESALGIQVDGTLTSYPSYVNRVYGLTGDDGSQYIAKFYRPGRWAEAALLDEHDFVADTGDGAS